MKLPGSDDVMDVVPATGEKAPIFATFTQRWGWA